MSSQSVVKKERRGYIPISYIKPQEENGIKVCLNCGAPIPKRRQKYCSEECSHEFFVKNNFSLLKFRIFERDRYTCQKCSYVYSGNLASYLITEHLECDHIIPIALGGDEFDPDNLQTLCVKCHKEKTKEDMKRLAEIRREEK